MTLFDPRRSLLAAAFMLGAAGGVHAQTAPPPAETPAIYEIVDAVSAERLEADLRTLTGFGTRHTASETESDTRGIGAARRWVYEEFERISAQCGGCLEVRYVSRVIGGERRLPDPVDVVSVVAIQRGALDPERTAMIIAHLDSRASDVMDAQIEAPGANDDGSGVVGAIEAARVLSQHEFAGTIVYAALAGEEQGLYGAEIVAQYAQDQGWRVKAVLNNDMIGNIAGIDGVIDNSTVRVFSEGTRAV